jgi:hypothetical protein
MTFDDIDGRQVFVVYRWTRNDVTIVGVTDGQKEADKLREEYIADGGEDEKFTDARKNNTLIESHFINKALRKNA